MSIANARTILGFDLDTILTIEIITKRYRELMKQYHPDRHADSSEAELKDYTQKSIDINNAYVYLKQNIDRVNTTKTKQQSNNDDVVFFLRKAKATSMLKSYFINSKDSKLKRDVSNLYNRCNIENATNNVELKKSVDMFLSFISLLYKNEETRYRIINKIPASFKYEIDYNTDVDSFLRRLYGMVNVRKQYIDSSLDRITLDSFIDDEYSSTTSFLEFRKSYMNMLFNANLTSEEEKTIFKTFRVKSKEISDYYEKNRKEYFALIRKVNKMDETYISKDAREELLNRIEESIVNKQFTSTKISIERQINKINEKRKLIRKLKTTLMLKYKSVLLVLNPNKDNDRVNSAINTYDKVFKILDDAENGKYNTQDLIILENISFLDEDKDKLLLSMFNNDLYNIFVSFPKDGKSKRYEPFVLGNANVDNFISLDNDSVNVKTKEEISDEALLLPLSIFVNKGNVVNLSRRTRTSKETILCQYGNYELVFSQDLKSRDSFYYLRPSKLKYENYGDRDYLLQVLENDICDRFLYYTDRMQKNNVKELRIKTSNE